jgi:hypothetical protein
MRVPKAGKTPIERIFRKVFKRQMTAEERLIFLRVPRRSKRL